MFAGVVFSSLPALSCGLIAPSNRVSRRAFVYLTPNHKWGFYLFIYFLWHTLRCEQRAAKVRQSARPSSSSTSSPPTEKKYGSVGLRTEALRRLQPPKPTVTAGTALISGSLPEAVVPFIRVEVKQIWISWYEWKENVRNYGAVTFQDS